MSEINITLKDAAQLREVITKLLLENALLKKEKNELIDHIDEIVERKIETRRMRKIMGAMGF